MGFIDSYKHLEKLCGEILADDKRISAYIDEMSVQVNGARYVRNWDEDLQKLKHYRWIRNKIAHEPGCTEANMCSREDELWLDEFYSRLMTQTDPLCLYSKAINSHSVAKPVQKTTQDTPTDCYHYTAPIAVNLQLKQSRLKSIIKKLFARRPKK